MKASSSNRSRPLGRLGLPAALVAALGLTGCYTQLATRGYAAVEAPATQTASPVGDSLAADSALARGAAPAADTLAPRTGAPAVIVNNYYDAGPTYRGYAQWEWDYPLLSVGYYSSRFDRFSRPWWWDDPWYNHRRHHHHHHQSYSRPIVVRPQTPAGPYKSETRLYNPDPSYAPVRKGRRAQEPAAQPAQVQEPRQEAQPAPKSSSSSSESSSSGSGSQSSQDDSKRDDNHPTLKKGRRR